MFLNSEETVIVDMIVKGCKNVDIAEEMGYSEATVKKRLTLIYKKLGISNRLDLIRKILSEKNWPAFTPFCHISCPAKSAKKKL